MVQKILSVCNGCCCGHSKKGNPPVQNALFDALVKEEPTISIERPYCLGPCNMANVVKLEMNNKEYWFERMNTENDVKAVVAFAKTGKMLPSLKEKILF